MVKLPANATIASDKLTKYLLKLQPADDKSKFLSQAGYQMQNWKTLADDLRTQILSLPAIPTESGKFGDSYEIRGVLTGPNGNSLHVITIWMIEYATQQTKFITLYPNKEIDR